MQTCHLPFRSGNEEVDGEKCDINKIKHEASVAKASVVCFTSDFWAYKVDNTQHDTDGEHQIWYHSCQYAEELIQSGLCQCFYCLQIKIWSFCRFDILRGTSMCTVQIPMKFSPWILAEWQHIEQSLHVRMLSTLIIIGAEWAIIFYLDNTVFKHIHLKSGFKQQTMQRTYPK